MKSDHLTSFNPIVIYHFFHVALGNRALYSPLCDLVNARRHTRERGQGKGESQDKA